MNIKHVNHIVTLAEFRNFARAAERLHISQPALSRSIQAAEAACGLRLFDRGTLEVTLTPAGKFMLERARQLVFDSRCLKRDLDLYRERKLGDTAFGVGPTPVANFLSAMLIDALQSHEGIKFRVTLGNWELLLSQLRSESIEFFIAETRDLPQEQDLLLQALRQERGGFYVRAGHPLASATSVTMPQIWSYGVATVRLPQSVSQSINQLLGFPKNEVLPISLECDDVATLSRVAQSTQLVLGAIHTSVVAEVQQGLLIPLPVAGLPPLYADMGIVTLRGRALSPMAELLVQRLPHLLPQA